ncbi:AI-2E family transporter [Acinetobacter pittii]|uniref:AI-2E family transporter n=1 Tax=Acinetobacter pittii TaxID=48296 RepID=UPI0002FFBB73|nr:AI-2E family transporter [Acinetobacter pittii]MDX8274354.1 AI-2E family transporter [Acinetobacter pittii]SSP22320.1 permease [Acinetobacter pittii]
MQNLNNRQSLIASYILMGIFLLSVIPLHLLASFFAGFLIYEIIISLSSVVERYIDGQRARIFISILHSIVTISLIGFFITSLISFVVYDLKGVGLHSINSKVDQTLLHLQAEITKYLPGYIPDSVTDLKDEIFAFMKDNVTTLKNTSSDILHNFVTMVMGLIIGILVAIHGFHRRTPQPVFKSLLIQRIQKLSISFKNVVFAQIKISAINTLLFILFAFILLPLWGVHLPFAKTLTILTFMFGLIPILGNLLSNTLTFIAALTISLGLAGAALLYLVLVHKLEYFINAKIIGHKINANAWEILLAMLVFESIFGLGGLIAAPIFYAYLKLELKDAGLI